MQRQFDFLQSTFSQSAGAMVTSLTPTDVTRKLMADFSGANQALIPSPSCHTPLTKEAHTEQAVYVRQSWDWLCYLHQGKHRLCIEGGISIPSKHRPGSGQPSLPDPDAGIGYCTLNSGPNYK